MNAQQREAMIRFHEKAAKAYAQYGQHEKAKAAQAQADKLRKSAR